MDRLFLWAVSFCACEKKYHVRPKTANRHGSEKIMLSRQALLSKMNVFLKSACYILSPLAPYFPLYVLFGPWFNVSNAPFLLLSMLSLMKHPHISLSYSHYTFGLLFAHFPALSDLAILPLLHSIFLMFFPPCFNSIMDVHKAQFTSRAFSIISGVNSLAAPASPLRVFVEAEPGSLSAFTLLTRSLHQPDAQPAWQITPICLGACVKDTHGLHIHRNSSIWYMLCRSE